MAQSPGLIGLLWAAPLVLAGCRHAQAQPLSVEFRNQTALPTEAVDQHGVPFTVTGVSGICHIGRDEAGAERCLAVLDNSNKLIEIAVRVSVDGTISGATIVRGIALSETRDFEDIVPADAQSVWLCEEGGPGVRRYSLADGAYLGALATPAVYSTRRDNLGFEALARDARTGEVWACNEETLAVDGPVSTAAAGGVARLLRFDGGTGAPAEQRPYVSAPLHGSASESSRSGMVAMIVLPNGRKLTLERSAATIIFVPTLQSRIYEIDVSGATDVSGLGTLIGAAYTPVAKSLLWSGGLNNLEGLCFGPALPDGRHVLIGVVDDGDPISLNRLASFVLTGPVDPVEPECAADWNGTDGLDSQDYFDFLEDFFANPPDADFNGVDGTDSQDFFDFLEAFFTGCE